MSIASTLLEIVTNNPKGVLIYCPNVNEICRGIYADTGVMLKPERQQDFYESDQTNYYGENYIKERVNRRKFILRREYGTK